jgi:hypothetical protein
MVLRMNYLQQVVLEQPEHHLRTPLLLRLVLVM